MKRISRNYFRNRDLKLKQKKEKKDLEISMLNRFDNFLKGKNKGQKTKSKRRIIRNKIKGLERKKNE